MNTAYLEYLMTIAHYRSISQAADALHLQRAYLSKVLQSVERELGVTLFVRSPRGVLITEEGEQVLAQLRQVQDILEGIKAHTYAAKAMVYPQYHDEVTLFVPPKLRPRKRSAQYLPAFGAKFPNVALSIIEAEVSRMMDLVREQPLAVAMMPRSKWCGSFNQPIGGDLCFVHVADVPLVALASPNNPLAGEYQSVSLASLLKQELVFIDVTIKEGSFLQQVLQPYGKPNIRYSVSSIALFYQLLAANPYFSIGLYSEDANDDLLQIPIRDHINFEQGILYRKDSLNNVVGKGFIELLLASYH